MLGDADLASKIPGRCRTQLCVVATAMASSDILRVEKRKRPEKNGNGVFFVVVAGAIVAVLDVIIV